MALKAIEKMIQLCGNNIKSEAWEIIIDDVGQASENIFLKGSAYEEYGQQILQNGFKCMKLIINNYI